MAPVASSLKLGSNYIIHPLYLAKLHMLDDGWTCYYKYFWLIGWTYYCTCCLLDGHTAAHAGGWVDILLQMLLIGWTYFCTCC